MATLSARGALTQSEEDFCRCVHAANGKRAAWAFQRAFCYRNTAGDLVLPSVSQEGFDPKAYQSLLDSLPEVGGQTILDRAAELLREDHIQARLQELKLPAAHLARGVLVEHMLGVAAKDARPAAIEVLRQEERAGHADAVDMWAEHLINAGSLVDVPLPREMRHEHVCTGCGQKEVLLVPVDVTFPDGPAVPEGAPRPGVKWPTIKVSFADVVSRRAFIRLPPEARIALAKAAGAPWSEVNPDADLSEEQRDVIRRMERTGVIEGGTGLGKSMLGGIECGLALLVPFDRAAFIGDKFDHVGKEFYYAWRFMRGLFGPGEAAFTKLEYIRRKDYHVYVCDTIWGSKFIPLSMDQDAGGSALGEFIHWVGLCEGSQISVRVLYTKILRAADRALQARPGCESDVRETGRVRAYTTPDGADGAARELVENAMRSVKGKLEQLQYGATKFVGTFFHLVAKSTMNPQFSRNVMAHREHNMTSQAFREVYGGEAAPHAGRVYPLVRSRHVVPMPDSLAIRAMRIGLGIDTGKNYAAVLVGLDPDLHIWALGETYESEGGIEEKLRKTDDMLLRVLAPLGVEKIEQAMGLLDQVVWDRSSQFKYEIAEHFRGDLACSDPYRSEGTFDLLPTIDFLVAMIKDDNVWIVEECEDGLTEFDRYIWQQRPSPARKGYFVERKPIDDFNHWLDAFRYIALPLREEGPLTETRSVHEIADIWNQGTRDWRHPHKDLERLLREAGEEWGQ